LTSAGGNQMVTRKKLSLVEEFGPVVERLGVEKEDVIQSCIFLIREEGAKDIAEELDWDVTSTSVGSAKISILIDQLMDFGLLDFLSNKGYILTGKGRKLLLNNIPEDLKKKYNNYIESVIQKDKDEIVKSARKKYLEKEKLRYNV
jgi:hypothetical protein